MHVYRCMRVFVWLLNVLGVAKESVCFRELQEGMQIMRCALTRNFVSCTAPAPGFVCTCGFEIFAPQAEEIGVGVGN